LNLGGLLHIPTPHHLNKKQPTSAGPNVREDYNYWNTTVSYAEKKYFTFRMHSLLKLCYETWTAGHFRYLTFRVYEHLRQHSKTTMMRTAAVPQRS
jgi:hypothetical protein